MLGGNQSYHALTSMLNHA